MQKSNWKEFIFKDLGQIITGKTPSTKEKGVFGCDIPFLTPTDITNQRYISTTNRFLSKTGNFSVKKFLLPKNSISVTCIGSDMGKVVINARELITNQQINSIIINSSIVDYLYLYYALKKRKKELLNLGLSGSTMPILNKTAFSNLKISLPPLDEQKRIAGVLGAFDDKIELLQKQNTTLENMAKALFKSWFVDFDVVHAKQQGQPKAEVMREYHLTEEMYNLFPSSFEPSALGPIPTGWQVKPLSQIATFLNGLALQKYSTNNKINFLPVIKIAELRNGLSASSDKASCDIPAEYIVFNGDILFSWSGSLMVKIWSGPKGALNQHLFKVSSLDYPKWFYYMWIKEYLPFFQEIAADKATTMGHIQRKHLDQALVCIPQNLNIYTRYFAKLIDKQILNNKQIQTLTEMRDALLPRLISGKIRV